MQRRDGAVSEDAEILTVDDPTDLDALYERIEALFDESVSQETGRGARRVAMQHPFEKKCRGNPTAVRWARSDVARRRSNRQCAASSAALLLSS